MYQAIERCLPIIVDELTLLLSVANLVSALQVWFFFFWLKTLFSLAAYSAVYLISVIWSPEQT